MPKRVLVVDDTVCTRSQIRDILVAAGYEVEEIANGAEAVERFRELRPDLVTMDIVLPRKSGIEATREIVREYPGARVVICSGLNQETLVAEAVAAGAAVYLVKPFQPDDVLRVVRRALGEVAEG
jgi:two-component system chemotaxis response regulator CheY